MTKFRSQVIQAAENVTNPPGRIYTMHEIARVRQLAAAEAALLAVRAQMFNCDCLPKGTDGRPSDADDAVYCQRDVVLVSDLDTALAALRQET